MSAWGQYLLTICYIFFLLTSILIGFSITDKPLSHTKNSEKRQLSALFFTQNIVSLSSLFPGKSLNGGSYVVATEIDMHFHVEFLRTFKDKDAWMHDILFHVWFRPKVLLFEETHFTELIQIVNVHLNTRVSKGCL